LSCVAINTPLDLASVQSMSKIRLACTLGRQSSLSRQKAVPALHQFHLDLDVWRRFRSFSVFSAFASFSWFPGIQILLAVCYRTCIGCAKAICIFFSCWLGPLFSDLFALCPPEFGFCPSMYMWCPISVVETCDACATYILYISRRVCIARTIRSQDVCPSVRLSVCRLPVCLSHAGILSKRLNIS